MSRIKKVIAGVVAVALVGGAAAGGVIYMKRSNQKEVLVVSVDSVARDYYMQDTSLEGQIATNVSQNINFDKDMIVQELYVEKGSAVSRGDPLISFDMTLVEMELNIAKLKKQQLEQKLNTAVSNLKRLESGGPIKESDADSAVTADNLSNSDGENLAYMDTPILASLFDEGSFGDGGNAGDSADAGDGSADNSGYSSGDFGSGESFSSGTNDAPLPDPTATPTPTPALAEGEEYFEIEKGGEEVPGIFDGEETFYMKLDGDASPLCGSGTEEDPFVFLCSSYKGMVTATGAFLNRMAGYNAEGTEILKVGGYWFQLEFHENDQIADYQDRKKSCQGYYLIDGSLLVEPVDMTLEMEFTLDEALKYQEEILPEEPDVMEDLGETVTISREDAIKIQKSAIKSLNLDLQESEINISKLEKKLDLQIIYSKLDGVVSEAGDPVTGTYEGSAFLSVKSKDGYYVKGVVSELLLDQMEEGTKLSCTSYESGSFEAEVVDVSEYPVSSSSYYGSGNPNVSYYSYSALISDASMDFSTDEWLSVTLKSQVPVNGSIVLDRAFVRSENGTNYVYKEENGILKKQLLSVGGNTDGGYSVLVKSGISREDKIAFPYGKDVQEGARTREGTLDELYGY